MSYSVEEKRLSDGFLQRRPRQQVSDGQGIFQEKDPDERELEEFKRPATLCLILSHRLVNPHNIASPRIYHLYDD